MWSCISCSFVNSDSDGPCEICGIRRELPTKPRPPTWSSGGKRAKRRANNVNASPGDNRDNPILPRSQTPSLTAVGPKQEKVDIEENKAMEEARAGVGMRCLEECVKHVEAVAEWKPSIALSSFPHSSHLSPSPRSTP